MESLPEEKFLNPQEQAQYCADKGCPVSPKTLNKLVTAGGGPRTVKFGNRRLSTASWLDEWLLSKLQAKAQ